MHQASLCLDANLEGLTKVTGPPWCYQVESIDNCKTTYIEEATEEEVERGVVRRKYCIVVMDGGVEKCKAANPPAFVCSVSAATEILLPAPPIAPPMQPPAEPPSAPLRVSNPRL